MEREGMTTPLLIGGATTSKAHTAVRIEPAYSAPVVHVLDASRAVGVASALLDPKQHDEFVRKTRADYEQLRAQFAERDDRVGRLTLAEARAHRLAIDWSKSSPPRPSFLGVRALRDVPIADLATRIDWSPFFAAWELPGSYPAILDDDRLGKAARSLFEDAQKLLARVIDERLFTADGVVGFWPAASTDDDDILLFADDSRTTDFARLHTLRQQMAKRDGRPNLALSDFTAGMDSGVPDYVGAFAVTAGVGLDGARKKFESAGDDYSAILLASLADRLAEAFAEWLHEKVRRELWGYAADESLSNEQIVREEYQGIRPAPGYPASPDHTEKRTIFNLLDAERQAGIRLTETMAMVPGSSVSGLYFWHPQAAYFGLGRIGRDQLADYARRKGWSIVEAEKWLALNVVENDSPNAVTFDAGRTT
jgi:5-methyltetrahydrofolate--homocysteine methyltransferase